ncbi:MAG: hypothetical protein HFE63_01390 [Clostridiales bacterium]|nr:hypothetical protein [Clostridiales bacterium]
MAFHIHTVEGGYIPSFEYLPASITPKVGMALKLLDGKLALASGTDKPEYISMCEKDEAIVADELIPVIKVSGAITFAAPTTAAQTAVNIGDKVTIHTDGMQVTATKTGGCAVIVGREGTDVGDIQYIRFDS